MGYQCKAEVEDRTRRTGEVAVFDSNDELILTVGFVDGTAAVFDPPGPSEELVVLAKAAFRQALVDGPVESDEPMAPDPRT